LIILIGFGVMTQNPSVGIMGILVSLFALSLMDIIALSGSTMLYLIITGCAVVFIFLRED
jgi:uncharacterized protein YybS (DUF2232 family)